MGKKLNLLVDTDIFIDYFNHQLFAEFFEGNRFCLYYSVVTRKELFSKEGLAASEKKAIQRVLGKCKPLFLEPAILGKYSELRSKHPSAEKEDTLIAATAIAKKLCLATRNHKHFRIFKELHLYFGV